MAYLEIKLTGGQSRKLALREGENLLGSGGEATVVIKDPLVAPVQARVMVKGEQATVVTLFAANPLFLNGTPLAGEQALGQGDQLILGSTRLHYFNVDLDRTREMLEMSVARDPEQTTGPIPVPAPAPLKAPAGPATAFVSQTAPPSPPPGAPFAVSEEELYDLPHLEMTDPTGRVFWILLQDKEVLAGSAADCPLRFEDPLVEPRHAKFIRRDDGVFIVDMESGQGVFLNNRRVFREALKEGDVVRVGHRSLVFRLPRPRPQPVTPAPAPEAAPAEGAAAPPAAGPAAKGRPAVGVWIAAAVAGVLIVVALAAAALWYYQARHDTIQKKGNREVARAFLDKREWKKAEEFLLRGDGRTLAEAEKGEMLARIQMELEASEQMDSVRQALKSGEIGSALEFFFRIPTDSVCRPEAGAMIVREAEARIDSILQRPVLQNQDFTEIVTLSEKVLQVDPRSAAARSYICLARFGENNLPEALASAEELIAEHPQAAEGHFYKALALYRSGKLEDSMASVEEALQLRPDDPDTLLLRAKLAILLGRLGDARLDLSRVLAVEPANEMARALYQKLTGEPTTPAAKEASADTARALLQRRRQAPGLSAEEEAACQAYLQGDAGAARQKLQDLARHAGESPQAARYRTLEEKLGRIQQLYEEGNALASQDPASALGRWEEMRSLEQATLPGRRSRYTQEVAVRAAELFAGQAGQDLAIGQLDRAYALALKSLSWQPEQAQARGIQRQIDDTAEKLYLEGFRHYRMGDAAGAREYWAKVLRTVPEESPWNRKAGEKLAELEE